MFKEFKTAQSLLDYLKLMYPGIEDFKIISLKPRINEKAAKALYKMWKDEESKINEKEFKISNFSHDELDLMEREGLISVSNNKSIITNKGSELLKTIILSDERSAYHKGIDDDINLSALSGTSKKVFRSANKKEEKSQNWYRRNV